MLDLDEELVRLFVRPLVIDWDRYAEAWWGIQAEIRRRQRQRRGPITLTYRKANRGWQKRHRDKKQRELDAWRQAQRDKIHRI